MLHTGNETKIMSPYIQKIQLSRTAEKWLSSMKFHHCLLKILRKKKKNVADAKSQFKSKQ